MRTLAAIFLAAILAACLPVVQEDVLPTPTLEPPTPTMTATPVPPSSTPSPSPLPTDSPTPAPTQTPTVTPTPSPEPCLADGGRIAQHTLATDLSPLPWQFRIYTPPCYDQHTDSFYPVLILIHGSTYTDSQWDDLGADETADRLIGAGEIPPFIILMPRDRVWTEPEEDPFGEALVTHILPWLDANYRTVPLRDYRAIGGLSRGASWSVHLGLKHWGQFSAIGAHSLPMFVNDPARIKNWLQEIPSGLLPRIYVDIGDKDYLLDKAVWFENLLTSLNIPHEWYLNTGRHEDAYWSEHLEQYLRWYTAAWSPPPFDTSPMP